MPVSGVSVRGGEREPSGVGAGVGVAGGGVVGCEQHGVGGGVGAGRLGVRGSVGVDVGVAVATGACVEIGAAVGVGLAVGVALVQPIANAATIAINDPNVLLLQSARNNPQKPHQPPWSRAPDRRSHHGTLTCRCRSSP